MHSESRCISRPAADLGEVEYGTALHIQKQLVGCVKTGRIEAALIALDHPPVYTVGRKPVPENYPGIEPVVTERGGDITYHGPGQLVIYPILDVRTDGRRDVPVFMSKVLKAVSMSLEEHGLRTESNHQETGIWVGGKKVGSVGMAIDGFVSYHGVAINTSGEVLPWFSRIRPCGLDPSVMSYVNIPRDALRDSIFRSFSEVFGKFSEVTAGEMLEISSGFSADIPDSL